MTCLRYMAVPGVLMPDPVIAGRYIGRKALPAPVDGHPAGMKNEEKYPIDPNGGSVDKRDRVRYMHILDALKKGIDLKPMDAETAAKCGVKLEVE